MKANIILLGHRARAGKDTAAQFLVENGYMRAAFADKLKDVVADLFRFSHEQMHGALKDVPDERYPNYVDNTWFKRLLAKLHLGKMPPKYFTPRRILQLVGQMMRRLFPNIWVAYVFESVITPAMAKGHSKFAISDLRFRNEGDYSQRWGKRTGNRVSLVKVYRHSTENVSGSDDISEHDMDEFDDWDDILLNDGTLEELRKEILAFADLTENASY